HPALDRLGDALGGQARLQPGTEDHLAALVVAADVRDVGGHLALTHLQRGAVKAGVGDVVLAAPVRAAAHLDVDPASQAVADIHLLQPLLDRLVEAHRAGDAHLAAVRARAADHVGDLARAGLAEPELDQPLPDVVERLVADPA